MEYKRKIFVSISVPKDLFQRMRSQKKNLKWEDYFKELIDTRNKK